MKYCHPLLPVCLVAVVICQGGVGVAQPLVEGGVKAREGASETQEDKDLAKKRVESAKRLLKAQRALESASGNGTQPPERLADEVRTRKQLDLLISQQQGEQTRQEDLSFAKAELAAKLKGLRIVGPTEKVPFSFLLLDQLRDQLAKEFAQAENIAAAKSLAQNTLQQAKASHEENERARRKAKEALKRNADETDATRLASELAQAESQSEVSRELFKLREMTLANDKMAEDIHELRASFLREKTQWVAGNAVFSKADLDERLFELAKSEVALKKDLKSAQADLDYTQQQWSSARQALDSTPGEDGVLAKEVEGWRVTRQSLQQTTAVVNHRLQLVEDARTVWRRRFKAFKGAVRAEWEEEAKQRLEQLARKQRLLSICDNQLHQDLAALDKRLLTAEGPPDQINRWSQTERDSLQELGQSYDQYLTDIQSSRRLQKRFLSEIGGTPVVESTGSWLAAIWYGVVSVWNYEITVVDDRPITVRTVVSSIILLLMGIILSRLLSRVFGQRILPRLGMHRSAAAAMQSLTFYAMVVMSALWALRFVNVPLTLFTFMGGAIAIGVGFGSKNVVNDFISGLILLAERPIRTGDLVQLDDLFGTVEHIGARSTRITTATNLEITVPNSNFLENNVVNWTLANNMIRTSVRVGVAYGSPTRIVTRLLKRAADEHGLILDKPEPFVWFSDFGDNSLNFELHFFVEMRYMLDSWRTRSDIRYKINELLNEAGITIAFPQRDVHLDTAQPLKVQVALPDYIEAEPHADDSRGSALGPGKK